MENFNFLGGPKPFVFVLMPFEEKFDDIYKLGIKETAVSIGAYAERVDEQLYTESILDRIYNQIQKADVIVADMSQKNANVFYEVGYAHALNKIVLLLTQSSDDIPFDLKHRPHIVYKKSISNLKKALLPKLRWAIVQGKKGKESSIDWSLAVKYGKRILSQSVEEPTKIQLPSLFQLGSSCNFKLNILNIGSEETPAIIDSYVFVPERLLSVGKSKKTEKSSHLKVKHNSKNTFQQFDTVSIDDQMWGKRIDISQAKLPINFSNITPGGFITINFDIKLVDFDSNHTNIPIAFRFLMKGIWLDFHAILQPSDLK